MTEEIKEMLWKIKRQNTYDDIGYFKTPLSNDDADKFLNYITNLQKENNQHISDIQVLMNKKENLERLTKKLQKENEQLRTELNSHKLKNEKATSLIKRLQKQYGYVLDDLLFLLLQGGDE